VMLIEGIPFSAALAWVDDFHYRLDVRRGTRRRPAVFAGRESRGPQAPQAARRPTRYSQI
jgi:hypothetical protein